MITNPKPSILLASGSAARKAMLDGAGLSYAAIPAAINEAAMMADMDFDSPESVASALAEAKAAHFSASHQNTLIIGSDQVLSCDGSLFSKAHDIDQARDKLKILRGKTHHLISSICIYYNGQKHWEHTDTASLHMNDFDNEYLEKYLKNAGSALTSCVGAYALEEKGAWLFDKIEGNYFTILGMPLLPLLAYLRDEWGYCP